jgi:hypothetical protein
LLILWVSTHFKPAQNTKINVLENRKPLEVLVKNNVCLSARLPGLPCPALPCLACPVLPAVCLFVAVGCLVYTFCEIVSYFTSIYDNALM